MRLELGIDMFDDTTFQRFNSIKVRLELLKKKVMDELLGFQFHKGAIRTQALRLHLCAQACFNSIKVRLERAAEIAVATNKNVSIP